MSTEYDPDVAEEALAVAWQKISGQVWSKVFGSMSNYNSGPHTVCAVSLVPPLLQMRLAHIWLETGTGAI